LDSKTIAAIIVFTALTLALNLSPIKIPAPYAPFLIYQIWEIPIVAAYLLYGTKVGVSVAVINAIALLIIFPGALPTGPLYNLIAILSMLGGIYVVQRAAKAFRSASNEYATEATAFVALATFSAIAALIQSMWWVLPGCIFGLLTLLSIGELWTKKAVILQPLTTDVANQSGALLVTASTIAGVFTRSALMCIVNLIVLPFPPPIGFSLPTEAAIALLPLIGVFNATLALYTIPIGHIIARLVRPGLRSVR